MEKDPIINKFSTDPIIKADIRTALRKMKNGKTGGKDEIKAELLIPIQNILGTRESAKNMEAGADR